MATGTFQGKPSKTFNRARAAIASNVINFLTNLQTKLLIHIPIQIDQGTFTLLNLHKGEAKTTTHHPESPRITTNHHESPRITTNNVKSHKGKRNEINESCIQNEQKE